jgi:hypothetical protein
MGHLDRCARILAAPAARGIGYPVAGYRAADLCPAGTPRTRSDPHRLTLDAEPELMSADERRQAAALLEEALQRLGSAPVARQAAKAETSTGPAPPSGPHRHVRSA